MKLYCLNGNPNKPCNILNFKGTKIMLDCGLDMSSVSHFLPMPLVKSARLSNLPSWTPKEVSDVHVDEELRDCVGRIFVDSAPEFTLPEMGIVNFAEVDVILISNYLCMLGLPYITEQTGFRGEIYMTEPTLQIGRLFMEELVYYIERSPRNKVAVHWKQQNVLKLLPQPLCEAKKCLTWKHCYSLKDVNASLAHVRMVGFSEKIDVFGVINVTPVSSGFCLGSCNWLIQSDYEKVAYISGSSTLTTHPRPMDQAALRNADILIMNCLTQTPLHNPDNMLGEFCMTVAVTIRAGGNVLVPCYPSGVTYDLFECLSGHLDNSGLMQTQVFFISPVADSSLAYSNIFAEWLSQVKQSKVYLPEEPFPHAHLVRVGRLKHFSSIYAEGFSDEFRSPCIVFCGHPSLRFGDAVHFMELWGNSSQNAIVFTEPDFPYLDALAPFQPLAMKCVYCPIDTGLSYAQANKLIRDLKPIHLVIPQQYTVPPTLQQLRTDLVLEADPPPLAFGRGDVLTLPIKRRFEQVDLDPELANALMPVEVKPNVAVATVTGSLLVRDNKHLIKAIEKPPEKTAASSKKKKFDEDSCHPTNYTWGTLDVGIFAKKLTEEGITDVKVEASGTGYIVHLQSDDTLIQVEENSTHIFCEDEKIRQILRNVLLQCLNTF